MAEWVRFSHNYDHRWPSGAVTEFNAGMTAYVKTDVAKAAIAAGAASKTDKPKEGEDGHVTTASRLEGGRRAEGTRTVRVDVRVGGHGYDRAGNPVTPKGAVLPDAADPNAVRAEPVIGAVTAGVPASAQAEAEEGAADDAAEQPGTATANQQNAEGSGAA